MNIVILGAGGHGKVVLDVIQQEGRYEPVAFLDADPARAGQTLADLPILGSVNLLPKLRKQDIRGAIVAIGDNRVRRSYAQLVLQAGLELVNAIHPASSVSPTAQVGRNVLLAAGCVLSTEAVIGDSVIINTGALVDHECVVEEGCHICPGAILAGRVRIGAGAFIGMGAKVLPCLSVGEGATIGAGAVVLSDVPPGVTVVGVPGRVKG